MAKNSTQAAVVNETRATISNPYSFASLIQAINNNFVIIFLLGLMFLAGFFAGSLWTENQLLKSGRGTQVAAAPTAAPTDTAPTGPTADQLKQVKPVDSKTDFVRGNQNAKVTLIEFSDYECPFCARFHPTMTQVMEEYGDKIRWVYRHYPLSFHPQAQKAAETAECVAKLQGSEAFWQFTDKIFEENTKLGGRLNADTAKTIALGMGVNATALQTCVDSGEMAAKVTAQLTDGTTAGITGTPGTIILTDDGQAELIPGAVPYEQVKTMLDKYVK
jgi:protein-disulfide isomerase